jgi:hypothetical protein
VVELPTTTTGGEAPDMTVLRQSIQQYLQSQNVNVDTSQSVMSVFVMDLETGQEMGINERVHHSATSTIKIGILANYFREKVQKPPDDVQLIMASMVVCSENSAANTLLELTNGEGDNLEGLRKTNDTLCEAGAVNSFITSKLDVGPEGQGNVAVGYYTPIPRPTCQEANMQNSALDSTVSVPTADFYLRSTAADMGTLLMNIYECAQYGTGLATIFPNEITQTECRWILELLEGTRFFRLGELGLPEDREVAYYAHKVGYGGEAVADAGVVFSPGGDYVLVMYLWDTRLDEFGQTLQQRWDLLAEVSRIVYNYFNPEAPVTQPRTPPNPLGGEGCVLPGTVGEINLDDIDENRFDENGNPLPSACYDWPRCVPFNGWGNSN